MRIIGTPLVVILIMVVAVTAFLGYEFYGSIRRCAIPPRHHRFRPPGSMAGSGRLYDHRARQTARGNQRRQRQSRQERQTPSVRDGKLQLAVSSVRIGQLPVPADQLVGPLIDQALDVSAALTASGAMTLQSVELRDGTMRLVGLQREGTFVERDVAQRIKDQATRPDNSAPSAPNIPGADSVPPGSTLGKPGNPVYLALGDSLTAGVGVPISARTLCRASMHIWKSRPANRWGLPTLASRAKHLDHAEHRPTSAGCCDHHGRAQARAGADSWYWCQRSPWSFGLGSVPNRTDRGGMPEPAACGARGTPTQFQADYRPACGRARPVNSGDRDERLQPVRFFGIGVPAEQMSNQTVKSLNDAIAAEAKARGWQVADSSAAIGERAAALTGILSGDVHPTALGYQAIAFALTQVYKKP